MAIVCDFAVESSIVSYEFKWTKINFNDISGSNIYRRLPLSSRAQAWPMFRA